MKKITLTVTAFSIAVFVLTGFVLSTQQQDNKPKATYQVGSSKVVVWENIKSDGTTWKNFQVEKIYKKGDEWATTNSFNETELIELKAAIDKAISEEAVTKK
jgi:hypothetical protein